MNIDDLKIFLETEILMNSVESSNIAAIGYNAEAKILAVEFENGGKYRYEAVPQDIWEEFQKSESKGKFLAKFIRGKFIAYQA